ncbi:hypothetical protein [Actinoallomurus sp. NPDC050550]|uniref:hypothetical protein n=1 Tax=Actinoallomurus sp. NPDC050550 TaxID=3154937 RepID=UPI0033C29238
MTGGCAVYNECPASGRPSQARRGFAKMIMACADLGDHEGVSEGSGIDVTIPSTARIYDFLLDGKDNK